MTDLPMRTPDAIHPHQAEAATFLSLRHSALLADAPRVGKTLSAIRACDMIGAKLVIIACPAHLRETWRREIERWRRGRWAAIIVGYPKVKDFVVRFRDRRADVLICDEAHFLKNRDSQRSVAVWGKDTDGVGGLSGCADRAWLLTGTPMTSSPLDLWPALHATAPNYIMRPNGRPLPISGFQAKYCATIQTPFGNKIVGSKNAKELRERIKPWVLRRTRAEVFGTDIQRPTHHFVAVGGAASKSLLDFEASDTGKKMRVALERGGLDALRKMADHAHEYRKMLGLAKVTAVSDYAENRLDEEDGSKLIVMAWHTSVIDALKEALKKFHPVVIDGRVDQQRKTVLVDRFQSDPRCRVFIGQIVAAGTGLTLSKADEVVFAELSWTAADNEQAGARSYAPGKSSPCLQTYVVVANSLDEEIARVAGRKEKDARKVLEQ